MSLPSKTFSAVPLSNAVDAAIDSAIASKRLVGAVVLIAQDGKFIHRRAAGLADRENQVAMKEDAIFRLASITKPFTAIAAMRVVEQGRIGLDDPITKWLPDFRPKLPDGSDAVILVRHLLSHTAGLSYGFHETDGPYAAAGVSDGLAEPGLSLAENLRRIATVPLSFAPGSAWQYSLAMDVLGGVIESETGSPLGDVIKNLITYPLGLHETAFSVRDRSRLAAAYQTAEPEPLLMPETASVPALTGSVSFAPSRIFDPNSYQSGGAGMAGTADDVLVVLEAIRKGGAPLLSEDSVNVMTVDQAGGTHQAFLPGVGFGFGWSVIVDPEAALVPFSKGTFKWGGAYGHSWFVDPVQKLTVVALTNTALEGMWGQFTIDLRDAVYSAL
ncbi:serine hydrolase domain-containing protein [Rhizobium tubonense]|uniref:Serine hydrolase n=1 Tax=Rhizobium tubonense TaxID=484088 RepID=A0A2W4D080_9HYPH|nr:serine hydrolase domain-containing protein [Rhizobium tubonense]PZM16931.1 serine hydrolase [Rhizobium tubonense]